MKELFLLLGLFSTCDLILGQACQLKFSKEKESKWTKLQHTVVRKLKFDVTVECGNAECRQLSNVETSVDKTKSTGCRCNKEKNANATEVYDCRCCFRIKNWQFLICLAAAVELVDPYKFFVFVTVDGSVITRVSLPLKAITEKFVPVCVPALLPPPLNWLSPCFKFNVSFPSEENGNTWKLCGKIRIGVYVVPVLTVYSRCFVISTKKGHKEQIDSMIMEGQHRFDEELDLPVDQVRVHDPANIGSVFCISNKRKKKAQDCKHGSRQRDVCPVPIHQILQEEKINWEESKLEQAPFLAYLHTNNQPIPVQKLHDGYPFLVELVDNIQKEQWMSEVPPDHDNQPGGSCGGALLTSDRLLTVCACVRSFYKANKMKKALTDEDEEFTYDLPSNQIFVRLADVLQKDLQLDTNGDKMMGLDSECAKAINDNHPAKVLIGLMIVMPITPKLLTAHEMFAVWPPGVLHDSQPFNLVAYGMKTKDPAWYFKNASGGKLDLHQTPVDFFLKKCNPTPYCKGELPNLATGSSRLACMCALNDKFQLVDGEIGFPLTANRRLLGLLSVPVDSDTGHSGGVTFDDRIVKEIEKYVGEDNFHSGRSYSLKSSVHKLITAPSIGLLYRCIVFR